MEAQIDIPDAFIELWLPIPGHPNYEVSSLGRVKSLARKHRVRNGHYCMTKERILRPAINQNGYLHLSVDGKDCRVHRIVAATFIDNSNNYRDVNHKNGDKTDNRVSNLEWVSHSQNELHKIYKLKTSGKLIKPMRQVLCVETGKVYESISAACRDLGIKTTHISEVCQGKISQTCGYHWRYVDGD